MQQTRKRSGTLQRGAISIVLVVALLGVAGLLLKDALFLLKRSNVHVEGLVNMSEDEALFIADITERTNFFSLNEKSIRTAIENNRYLVYVGMETHFPDGLTLRVRERVPASNFLYRGMQYILDRDGVVLERLQYVNVNNGLLTVTGFSLYSDMLLGVEMPCQSSLQLDAYVAILEECRLQGYLSQIVELNITSTESIFLVTAGGYTVHIGDANDLRMKIGTVRATIDRRNSERLPAGILDAAKPGIATYSPVGI